MSTQIAWAILTREHPGQDDFIGRYWQFPDDNRRPINSVLRTRLFEFRRQARAACRAMKAGKWKPYPKAIVAKVEIQIRVLKENP